MADPKTPARAAAEEIDYEEHERIGGWRLSRDQLAAIISRHYAPLETEAAELRKRVATFEESSAADARIITRWAERYDVLNRLHLATHNRSIENGIELADLRKERESAMRELRLTGSYDSLVDAVRQRMQAWMAAADNAEFMEARHAAAERLAEAARAECAKFNFPDEDRPELWAALSAYDAATKDKP